MVLAFLVGTPAVARLFPSRRGRRSSPDAARVAMATAMTGAGAGHLADPRPFVQHLPEFVPGTWQLMRDRAVQLRDALADRTVGARVGAAGRR